MGEPIVSLTGDEDPISREVKVGTGSHAIFDNSELFLSKQQRDIASEIQKKSQKTADLFVAALVILHEETNPVREIMASVALRNLMEKLPENFNFPAGKLLQDQTQKIRALIKEWDLEFNALGDQIDPSVQPPKFHLKFLDFREYHSTKEEIQRQRNEAIVSNLAGSESTPSVIQQKTTIWKDCHNYFSKRVHDETPTKKAPIFHYVKQIENFLADALLKKPFIKFDEIDAAIERLEA